MRIPTFKHVDSAEQFYKWVKTRLIEKQKLGLPVVFPAINRYHVRLTESDTEDETDISNEYLGKRCLELSKEKEEVISKMKRLEQENKQLLMSTQNWMLKFQEADLNGQKDQRTNMSPLLIDKFLSD